MGERGLAAWARATARGCRGPKDETHLLLAQQAAHEGKRASSEHRALPQALIAGPGHAGSPARPSPCNPSRWAVMALQQALDRVQQELQRVQQLGSPAEALQDPLVRGALAVVLCLLFILLLLKPTGSNAQQSKGGDTRRGRWAPGASSLGATAAAAAGAGGPVPVQPPRPMLLPCLDGGPCQPTTLYQHAQAAATLSFQQLRPRRRRRRCCPTAQASPRRASCVATRGPRWRSTSRRTTSGSSSRTRAATGSRWGQRRGSGAAGWGAAGPWQTCGANLRGKLARQTCEGQASARRLHAAAARRAQRRRRPGRPALAPPLCSAARHAPAPAHQWFTPVVHFTRVVPSPPSPGVRRDCLHRAPPGRRRHLLARRR